MTNLDSIFFKKQRHYFANKGPSGQGYGFSSGHVWMWELNCEESWVLMNWCFWTVVLENTLARPLDYKEIQPVHPKGDQSWVFFGRTDAEAETSVFWPPHAKSWLTGKDSDAGRYWGLEEKRVTKDEMAGWHHCLNGHEFAWTLEVGDGQGGLACCDSWGHKESDTTERLNWTEGIKGSSLHVSEIPSFLRSHNLPLYIYNITFCLSNSFVDGLCPLFRYCELCCMNIVYRYMFKTLFSIISGIHSQVKLSCEDLSTY